MGSLRLFRHCSDRAPRCARPYAESSQMSRRGAGFDSRMNCSGGENLYCSQSSPNHCSWQTTSRYEPDEKKLKQFPGTFGYRRCMDKRSMRTTDLTKAPDLCSTTRKPIHVFCLLWPRFQEQMFVELNQQLSIVAG